MSTIGNPNMFCIPAPNYKSLKPGFNSMRPERQNMRYGYFTLWDTI